MRANCKDRSLQSDEERRDNPKRSPPRQKWYRFRIDVGDHLLDLDNIRRNHSSLDGGDSERYLNCYSSIGLEKVVIVIRSDVGSDLSES